MRSFLFSMTISRRVEQGAEAEADSASEDSDSDSDPDFVDSG